MPTPAAAPPPQVFLSSTVRDLEAYRRTIREAVRKRAQTLCLLSEEDWPSGYDDTVDKCLRQIAAAQGFLLIIGHWYGSVPPGADRSITHIEFDVAFDRWKTADPRPMAVMMPKPGSSADKELLEAARRILKGERKRGLTAAEHTARLDKFRSSVTDSWKTVDSFQNKHELREIALTCCLRFQNQTFIKAATGAIPAPVARPVSQVSEGQLGAIGRTPHVSAAKAIMARLADSPGVPAVMLVATGDDDAGQRAFLQRLLDTVFRKHTPRAAPSALPVQIETGGLAQWIGGLLNLPVTALETPVTLADRVAVALKRQPLICAIDRIGDLAGGLDAFRDVFWTPFYAALRDLRQRDRFLHRLVVVLADYSTSGTPVDLAALAKVPPDCSREVVLPALGAITRADVLDWFDDMEVPDDASGRRAALADRVMNASKGVPLRAFNRLCGENLWPPGETDA